MRSVMTTGQWVTVRGVGVLVALAGGSPCAPAPRRRPSRGRTGGSRSCPPRMATASIHIYSVNADGTEPTQLTTSAGLRPRPGLVARRTKIAFTRSAIGNDLHDLVVMDVDGRHRDHADEPDDGLHQGSGLVAGRELARVRRARRDPRQQLPRDLPGQCRRHALDQPDPQRRARRARARVVAGRDEDRVHRSRSRRQRRPGVRDERRRERAEEPDARRSRGPTTSRPGRRTGTRSRSSATATATTRST